VVEVLTMDDPSGLHRRINRRRALITLGGMGIVAIAPACSSSGSSRTAAPTSATSTPQGAGPTSTTLPSAASCTLTPELTEGPYYLDLERVRRDITEGKPGVPLTLRTTVFDRRTCRPIDQAAVDVWHCDAGGVYSGFTSVGNGTGTTPPNPTPTAPGQRGDGTTYLRGVQLTGSDGIAEFTTIQPGWYEGRTVHIHVKVHIGGTVAPNSTEYRGGHVSHTGQLFFSDDINSAIAAVAPYRSNNAGRISNSADTYFKQARGAGIVDITPRDHSNPAKGMTAAIAVVVDPTATPPVT
jgi:protocatechuate 3,4-dioxygenase beta subunit